MLPNGFTLFNLFCGIYAIILALKGNLAAAPGFIVLGGIADALDGRVARATGTGSRFGEELDSLVDAISFGLAPALIVYMGIETRANLDWLLVFIYTACAVMRLARFNVEQAGRKKTYFHGLPSPAAGLTLATYYWFSQTPLYNETVILFTDSTTLAQLPWHNLLRGIMAVLAALMISDVPYPAMPSIGFNSVKKSLGTLLVIGAIALLIFSRKEFIFPALLAYVLFGLVKYVFIGFLGRGSTPDQIFWEREAELHQEDEERSAFDRPTIRQEALEDADEDEFETTRRPVRESRAAREGREPRESRESRESREPRESRESRESREPRRSSKSRDERRTKRRDEGRRKSGRGEDARREEPHREESHREEPRREEPRREEPRREEPRREESRRDEQRREKARAPEAGVEHAQEDESVIPPAARRDDHPPENIALENLAVEDNESGDEFGDETSSDTEQVETGRRPEDGGQVRKRRRRRGRGRGRGERGGQSDATASDATGDQAVAAPSGGDTPPGPSLPDTPDPSGTSE
jgi:CDP-diacylglycerol--serine O-phosphatidyltransferase